MTAALLAFPNPVTRDGGGRLRSRCWRANCASRCATAPTRLAALLFFVLTAALFPLAIGPAPETLGRIAPGIVWVCALLAALLPLDRLFGADFDDGSLDQLLLCGLPPAAVALAKAAAHWLVTGLPLLLAAAPLAVMLRLPAAAHPGAARWAAARHAAAVAARHHRGRASCWARAVAACCCPCWCCRSPRRC